MIKVENRSETKGNISQKLETGEGPRCEHVAVLTWISLITQSRPLSPLPQQQTAPHHVWRTAVYSGGSSKLCDQYDTLSRVPPTSADRLQALNILVNPSGRQHSPRAGSYARHEAPNSPTSVSPSSSFPVYSLTSGSRPTPRSGAPSRTFIHHRDRIKQFNIHPGDRVRLLTGKAMHKYNDESQGEAGGWKLYTVKTVDMKLNRVFLEGLTVGLPLLSDGMS